MRQMHPRHVTVCICTFRRPRLLRRLLEALERLETPDGFTFSVVVSDNDATRSAQPGVLEYAATSRIEIVYCSEPRQNIALARNRAIAHAEGEYIAFLDDDEFPAPDWLRSMLAACEASRASGVLGPVRPHFDEPPPRWVIDGRFCERPEHPTGTVMHWSKCRTGNLLFRREIIEGIEGPFREQFGTGGEDVDFFQRMSERGHVFVWCNEAIAYETVPPSRQTRRYMIQRALLRGRINFNLKRQRTKALLTSFVAVPIYTAIIPFACLFGQHVFMNYMIRCCDHLGRVLALLGINPVHERSG